jgi:hypothetical protein
MVALLLGLAGLGYRLVLLLLTVPGPNSDEATFGLAALHISTGREWPAFLYGQHYMGTVESYLAAPLFALFGPGWVLLRTPLLLLWAAFVYLTYRLARRLYSPWLATCTVGLLAPGSERVIRDQLTAVGGRPEIKPAVVLLLLLAVALAQRRGRHRWLAFGAFGLVAGLAAWDDWLVLPYLAASVVVLLIGCGRELLGRAGLLVLAGFVVGLLPLILDNLAAPPGQDSISVFQQLSHGESDPASLADRVHGTVLTGIPLATGLCPPEACAPWQGWWGPLYPALLLAGAGLAAWGLRRPGTPAAGPPVAGQSVAGQSVAGSPMAGQSPAEQSVARRIGYVAQLALVAGAALTVVAYSRNALSATAPLATARYLSVLQISLPAVLWPLWVAARAARRPAARAATRVAGAVGAAVLAAVAALMLFTTAVLIGQVGTIRDEDRGAGELAAALRRDGIGYTYGEYWTCNRLVFATRERVICSVLGDRLRPGQNRYDAYPERVRAAPRPAFVFATGEPADTAFRRYLSEHGVAARVTEVADYRIYQPDRPVRPWR